MLIIILALVSVIYQQQNKGGLLGGASSGRGVSKPESKAIVSVPAVISTNVTASPVTTYQVAATNMWVVTVNDPNGNLATDVTSVKVLSVDGTDLTSQGLVTADLNSWEWEFNVLASEAIGQIVVTKHIPATPSTFPSNVTVTVTQNGNAYGSVYTLNATSATETVTL